MKYNDICITESSWEELERDSFGGMTNASAYCLMYIDDRLPHLTTGLPAFLLRFHLFEYHSVAMVDAMGNSHIVTCLTDDTDDETGQVLRGMDSLPPVLRRYVHEDNRWFQQELSEWEEQFCQTAAPQGESTNSRDAPNPDPDSGQQPAVEPCTDQPEQARGSPEPEPGAEKESKDEPGEEHQGGCGEKYLPLVELFLLNLYFSPALIGPTTKNHILKK